LSQGCSIPNINAFWPVVHENILDKPRFPILALIGPQKWSSSCIYKSESPFPDASNSYQLWLKPLSSFGEEFV